MSDDSKELSRMEDILSGEDYLPKKPMSRIEELLLDGAMVPKVDDTDNGKVLKVIDGEWKPGEDVSGDNLPPVSSLDNGKVLKVVNGEWNIGSDKSDIVMVQMSVSYASFKDSSQVTLPANIKSVLLANYYNNPPVPTYLITTDSVIFQPIEVNKSSGTTPLVQIRWGRFHSEFDSVTRESNVYNDSIIYNTQDNDTVARFTKSKALQTIPPVDVTDNGKVMQVDGGYWTASELPTYDDVPPVAAGNVGMYLKATATGEYGWASIPKDALFLSFDFLGGQINLPTNLGITMANSNAPIFLKNASIGKSDYGKIFYPVSRDSAITLGVIENASWECVSVETVNGSDVTYIEKIIYNMDADNHTETATYSKAELKAGGGVAVPPVIFDDGNLKKMEILGFPGIEKVYLTSTAYSNLTTAQKEDLSKIYYVSDYEFATYNDGTLVLRTDSSNNSLLYFVGVVCTNSNPLTMPSELAAYIGDGYPDSYGYYDPTDTTSVDCYINCNWSGDNTKYWAQSGRHSGSVINDAPVYGVMNPSGGYGQELVYSDPFDIPNGFTIYYGNKQYTDFDIPDPLPAVSSVDNGKVLKVVSGAWDKSDIPRTNSVQIPPVIYDNRKLMKIADMTGFPELEKVFITSEEYSQLTTAQKQDLSKVYYISPYKFYTFKDGEITIRVNGTTYEWFFNGFILTDNFYTIPSEYRQYTKNDPYEGSTAWSDNTSSTSLGIIEMGPGGYTERISAQDGNWGGNYILNTPIYGKVIIGNGDSQGNSYSDPYDVETPILIYYGNKQYTDFTFPKELPAVTSSDNGKVLKVNSSGEWNKDIVYREISQADYDLLPASKNTDGIIYFITDNS